MTCAHAHDDGAYVLGALSPVERAEYERHLAGCPECREAVAEIAVLPGLLGRLDAAAFERIDAELAGSGTPRVPGPGPGRGAGGGSGGGAGSVVPKPRMPALLDAARESRRREHTTSRRRYVRTGLVAAALALVIGVGAGGLGVGWLGIGGTTGTTDTAPPSNTPTASATTAAPMVAMEPIVSQVPVGAEIGLTETGWGTEVTMRCWYGDTGKHVRAYTFRLVAHGADGAKEQVGSWLAAPGDTITVQGATRFKGDDLVRLEITRYDGTPLLAYDIP